MARAHQRVLRYGKKSTGVNLFGSWVEDSSPFVFFLVRLSSRTTSRLSPRLRKDDADVFRSLAWLPAHFSPGGSMLTGPTVRLAAIHREFAPQNLKLPLIYVKQVPAVPSSQSVCVKENVSRKRGCL